MNDNTQKEIALVLSGLEPVVNVSVQYIDVPDKPGSQVIAMYFLCICLGDINLTHIMAVLIIKLRV